MPTYLALADELERAVRSSAPGSRVASEHELVDAHSVSRLTARAALQELERRHLVRRVRGAGTFVARRIEYRISADMAPSWAETVRRAGGTPHQDVLGVRTAAPTLEVRRSLRLPQGARVTAITRRGSVDGEIASLSTSFLPSSLVPGIATEIRSGASLYRLLVERYGLRPRRLWSDAELVPVADDVAGVLGYEGRPPAWSLRSCNRCEARDEVIELAVSWLRADVFRVVLQLGADHR